MTASDRVMGLLGGGVPLTLLVDLAKVSALPDGLLLEAPSLDGFLIDDEAAQVRYEMAV